MTAGVAGRVSALLRGYGYAPADIDASLTRRLLALMFLHRFSDPRRHVAIPGWEAMAKDIAGLEGLLWPLG